MLDAGAMTFAQEAYDLASSAMSLASEANVVATSAATMASDAGTLASSAYDLASSAYGLASGVSASVVTLSQSVTSNASRIGNVEGLVPTQATPSNQLADKAFVNSSIQTTTANFRGNWSEWSDVPTDANEYPLDYAGSRTPTVNDYLVVQDASGYVEQGGGDTVVYYGTWRFKYSGTWATNGKNGWLPEYQVNETPMTAAQLAAINSNITASKVAFYDSSLSGLESLINSI